jgi:hypothetical protein
MAARDLTKRFRLFKTDPKNDDVGVTPVSSVPTSPTASSSSASATIAQAPSNRKYDQRLQDSIIQIHQSFDLMIEDVDNCTQKLSKIYSDLFYKMNSKKLKDEQNLMKTITSQLEASQKCVGTLKNLLTSDANHNMPRTEATIIRNLHQSLLQKYSLRVKKMNELLKIKAKHDESEMDDQIVMTKIDSQSSSQQSSLTESGTLMQSLAPGQMADFDTDTQKLNERSAQIVQIAKEVTQLNQMFVDLNDMVCVQGTVLDRVEYNIEHAKEHVEKGAEEIKSAENYQSRASSLRNKLMLTLGGIIATIGISYGIKKA